MSPYFNPISVGIKSYRPCRKSNRIRNPFNDSRRFKTYKRIRNLLSEYISCSIQQLTQSRKEAAMLYRFFENKNVTTKEIIDLNCQLKVSAIRGKRVLCLADTSIFNMSNRKNVVSDFENFGVIQDGKSRGFFSHPSLVLDGENHCVLGLSDILLWNRPDNSNQTDKSKKNYLESYKWFAGATNSKQKLQTAASICYVFDSEADDFDLFVHIRQTLQENFIIRSKYDRRVTFKGKSGKISDFLKIPPIADKYTVKLRRLRHFSKTHGKQIVRQPREANLELRYMSVQVCVPRKNSKKNSNKKAFPLQIVEVKETTSYLPHGEEPLHWILLTTEPVNSSIEAKKIVDDYLSRWTIEQLFRTMKKQGFDQQATMLGNVDAILKQTAMNFDASARIMALVNARDKEDAPAIDTFFDQSEQETLQVLNKQFEGKTEKQKNPYSAQKLSYAAWVIGRLGGWKGYKSQKPPGPITMKRGLDKFQAIMIGYRLFNNR